MRVPSTYRTAIMYTVVVGCEARKFDGDKFRRLGRLLIRNNLIYKRVNRCGIITPSTYGRRTPLHLFNNNMLNLRRGTYIILYDDYYNNNNNNSYIIIILMTLSYYHIIVTGALRSRNIVRPR